MTRCVFQSMGFWLKMLGLGFGDFGLLGLEEKRTCKHTNFANKASAIHLLGASIPLKVWSFP